MATPRFTPSSDVPETPVHSEGAVIFLAESSTPLSIPNTVLAAVCAQASKGFQAVPHGGAEVGGLFVGGRTGAGLVQVREIFPLDIEYRFGPAFRPSVADLAFLEKATLSIQIDPSNVVMGFYRSVTRSPKQLRDTDQEILAALQRVHTSYAADFRFLMVLGFQSKTSFSIEVSAGENGVWGQWRQYRLQLPLTPEKPSPEPGALAKVQSETVEAGALLAPQATMRPSTVASADLQASRLEPASVVKSKRSPLRLTPLISVVLGLILLGGLGWMYYQFKARHRAASSVVAASMPPISHTGFAASPEGGIWKLTWNREAVMAMNPTNAFLSIRDGANQEEILLTTADLATGMVFYTPQSGDLLFGLRVLIAGSSSIEERVRVLQPVRPPQASTQAVVRIVTEGDHVRTLRPFVPPAQDQRQPNPEAVALETPPVVTDNASRSSQNPIAATAIAPVAPPAPPTPLAPIPVAQTVTVPPPTTLEEPKLTNPLPVTYIAPKVIHQVSPTVPSELVLYGPVDVLVKVEISSAGKVIKATPTGRLNGANFTLVNAAMHAAQFWEFAPARQDGKPIPSTVTISFRFGPH